MHQPTLLSERLLLRPFDARDADAVQSLAGEWAIADTNKQFSRSPCATVLP